MPSAARRRSMEPSPATRLDGAQISLPGMWKDLVLSSRVAEMMSVPADWPQPRPMSLYPIKPIHSRIAIVQRASASADGMISRTDDIEPL